MSNWIGFFQPSFRILRLLSRREFPNVILTRFYKNPHVTTNFAFVWFGADGVSKGLLDKYFNMEIGNLKIWKRIFKNILLELALTWKGFSACCRWLCSWGLDQISTNNAFSLAKSKPLEKSGTWFVSSPINCDFAAQLTAFSNETVNI